MRSRSSGTTQVATTCQPASSIAFTTAPPTAPVAPVISTVRSLISGSPSRGRMNPLSIRPRPVRRRVEATKHDSGGRPDEVHAHDLHRRARHDRGHAGADPGDHGGVRRLRPGDRGGGRPRRRRGAAADGDRHHRARARRRAAPHRRPVRRDEGAARRLLPARVQGPRRGDRLGRQDPRRAGRERSRCARSWTTRPCAPATRERRRRRGRRRDRPSSSTTCSGASRDGWSPP